MARNFANIWTAIWRNDDFRALTQNAQHVYLLLTTQSDISAAGVLALSVRRWSTRAKDMTRETVIAALQELEAHRFVFFDQDAEELLVRSFVRWDGGYGNPKRRPVIRRAALEVESAALRRALAYEFRRLGIECEGLADIDGDSQADSLSASAPPADPPSSDSGEYSQGNSLSGTVSPSEGLVVTKAVVVEPLTTNPKPGTPPPADPAVARQQRGTRLPEGWADSDEGRRAAAWAAEHYPEVNLAEATLKFANHWLAKTGKDATKRDWYRTFQNWIMEENRRTAQRYPRGNDQGRAGTGLARRPIPGQPCSPADERVAHGAEMYAKYAALDAAEAQAAATQGGRR